LPISGILPNIVAVSVFTFFMPKTHASQKSDFSLKIFTNHCLKDAKIDWGTLESKASLAGVGLYSSVVEMATSNNQRVRIGDINRRVLPQYNNWKYIFIYGRISKGSGALIDLSPYARQP